LGAWLAWDGLLEPTLAAVILPKRSGNAYQDFLTLWKDADPDIPILKEAKAEYAKRVLSSALSRRVEVPLAPK
jgi:hypothetical protein